MKANAIDLQKLTLRRIIALGFSRQAPVNEGDRGHISNGGCNFLGGITGVLMTVSVGSITLSLNTSVGTLLAGLVVGHLRTRYPLFGRIPSGAVALMTSLGLAAFVGLTGIQAGPVFLSALWDAGLGLLFGGVG